jgi:hypothetical protein
MAEMETMFRDKFSENIRVSAILVTKRIRKGAIRIFPRHSGIVHFYLGSFGWVQSQSRQSTRLFLQSSELGPPQPSLTCRRVCPPLWFRGGPGGLAGEGGSQFGRGDRHWYSRYIFTLFVQL